MSTVLHKKCQRCGGRIFLDRTFSGMEWFCLTCGYRREASVAQLMLFPDGDPEADTVIISKFFEKVTKGLCERLCMACDKRKDCLEIYDLKLCDEETLGTFNSLNLTLLKYYRERYWKLFHPEKQKAGARI